ncbi:MAG: hypothetical protein ABFQ64_10110, partial [Campylobacterota bacterium]
LRGAFIMQHNNKVKSVSRHRNVEGMYFSDVIKQQLKHDAPYAWHLLTQSRHNPTFNQKSLQRLEERLESYMDCFILSEEANDSLLDTLNLDDWGAVYVMAKVALTCEKEEALTQALDTVNSKRQAQELSHAFNEQELSSVQNILQKCIVHENQWVRVACIETLTHFALKPDDTLVLTLLKDESIAVQVSTLRLIAKQKLKNYVKEITTYFTHENEALKYAAVYAGCMLQVPEAYKVLQEFCFTQNTFLKDALALLYCVIEENKIEEVYSYVSNLESTARIHAYNMAMAGYIESIPQLISQMHSLEHARYCGEAFTFITGVGLQDFDLIRIENLTDEEEEQMRASSKLDEWTQNYEEDLPIPDAVLVEKWWSENAQNFQPNSRYLAGKLMTKENLETIKLTGNQTQQDVATLILECRYS